MCRFTYVHQDLLLAACISACSPLLSEPYCCRGVQWHGRSTPCSRRKTRICVEHGLCLLAMTAVLARIKDKCFCLLGFCTILKFKTFNYFKLFMNTVYFSELTQSIILKGGSCQTQIKAINQHNSVNSDSDNFKLHKH